LVIYREQAEALKQLSSLIGQDLRVLAQQYGVTVYQNSNGKLNKGWAGLTIERCLGLKQNSSQLPDFGVWELKLISLKYLRTGELKIKETMAITMINPNKVSKEEFEESHLYKKMQEIVVVARIFEGKAENSSKIYSVNTFNLYDQAIYRQVRDDYNLIRKTIIEQGFDSLTGKLGLLIQPRTKGQGHGSKSRAFYARKCFLEKILK
jgi:DNA mismatch repair protein MutH